MTEKETIRVLEVRASTNGWVVSTFQREVQPHYDQMSIYRTYVAESSAAATKIIQKILDKESWSQEPLAIPPARGTIR